MNVKKIHTYLRPYLDVILFIISLLLFLVGMANLIPFPQYREYGSYSNLVFYETIYSLSFVFCAIFFVSALALRLELFEEKIRERKLANFLVCVSIPLMVVALVFGTFRVVVGERPQEVWFQVGKNWLNQTLNRLIYVYPYSQFSYVLVVTGICCLSLGLILRLRS